MGVLVQGGVGKKSKWGYRTVESRKLEQKSSWDEAFNQWGMCASVAALA
jgi:hypothetical protein